MTDNAERASRIAALNDEFRRQAGFALVRQQVPGRYVMTHGVAALSDRSQAEILERVRTFSKFESGNDPYGEHDFGIISPVDGEDVIWKIDYYEDERMEYGAENAGDPTRSFRVLTIMLTAEY